MDRRRVATSLQNSRVPSKPSNSGRRRIPFESIELLLTNHGTSLLKNRKKYIVGDPTFTSATCRQTRSSEGHDNLGCWSVSKYFAHQIANCHDLELVHIDIRILAHFFLLPVRFESIRKIQHTSTVAAIHQASQSGPLGHATHKFRVHKIVANLSSRLVVYRNKGFIVTVLFVAIIIRKTSSMTLNFRIVPSRIEVSNVKPIVSRQT